MDRSKLPGMTKKSFDISWPFGGKKKSKKKTKPGAMDDNAKARMKKQRKQLKDASDY